MSDNSYEQLILNTIDQLRGRKARPDLMRICHMLERKHGVNSADVKAELQRLVDANIIIKVDYKGSISYRNVSKSTHSCSNTRNGGLFNSDEVSKALGNAISQLTSREPTKTELGVSTGEIEKILGTLSLNIKLTQNELKTALEREVSVGAIKKLTTGNFVLATSRFSQQNFDSSQYNCLSSQNCVGLRKSEGGTKRHHTDSQGFRTKGQERGRRGRRKRFKKNPEHVLVDSASPLWSVGEDAEVRCNFCLLSASAHPQGDSEFLICIDCGGRASTKCMDYSPELAARARMYPWQCMYCKTCCMCNDSEDWDTMLICDACDKGFHMKCHVPKVTEEPTGTWICQQCMNEEQTQGSAGIVDERSVLSNELPEKLAYAETGQPTPYGFPVPDDEPSTNHIDALNQNSCFERYPEIIPDAKDWTIDDVEKFFTQIGFPEQAPAFREQEIDGKSLLLMKRSDVLTGLSIKLGPALKIYNHVKRLQTGLTNGHLL
ncbi:histone acetyltransferase KAT6A-like isoform X1 [Limulus polyphemus]|uniref:Histone acetyltransferase KAT6A-like isoform X1 n=1 Tax=Limulus polyphemus TaxID=6850 RepID=A0ABM1SPJ8_LIMPO|nr:histone acetyltransferase KAT6A-like isoform X1 [Limulus polyphemus]